MTFSFLRILTYVLGLVGTSLLLPLGISFWTFTLVSYLLDVRRGTIPAERHPGRYAAFVLFFPKIVSGPIERAGRFLPQVAAPAPFS